MLKNFFVNLYNDFKSTKVRTIAIMLSQNNNNLEAL